MSSVELAPYESMYASPTAQAFLQVFTVPPWNETMTLNDALSQLDADQGREGFSGLVLKTGKNVVGFSWWFEISGPDLNNMWRPRFVPREQVPQPEGCGVFLREFGVVPSMRNHGLGQRLLQATLDQIEAKYDWIALNTHSYAHAGLALLKSNAFEDLGLAGTQVRSRICMMRYIQR